MLEFGEAGRAMNGKFLLGAAVWVVAGPAVALWLRRRTIGALEVMLENAVAVAGRS